MRIFCFSIFFSITLLTCLLLGIVISSNANAYAPKKQNSIAVVTKDSTAVPTWQNRKWKTTKTGLKYRITQKGDGNRICIGDTVLVHFVWYSEKKGTPIFSTYKDFAGQPQEYVIGNSNLMPGFEQTILLMSEGAEAFCKIPPDLGFGAEGREGETIICYYIKVIKVARGLVRRQ